MFRVSSLAAGALLVLTISAFAQQEYPAKLAGHAVLPVDSLMPAPADAPADLKISGKYTTGVRVETLNSVEGKSAGRPTGIKLPFAGQPIQGHSGIKHMADDSYWILTDNGYGAKANSPDAMLYLRQVRVDWDKGTIETIKTVFLHDPDKKVPFRIVHEGTDRRYLTGADIDIEAFQLIGDKLWISDEFGPYLLQAGLDGRIEGFFETQTDGKPVMSPDHYRVVTPNPGAELAGVNLSRSRGFEGMAASADGRFLYALLEGSLWRAETKSPEMLDGKAVLRILEFSVADRKWTGRHWFFPLGEGATNIGDFNMLDATTGLVVERDGGEGTPDKACPGGKQAENCFHDLAKVKRVVKIEMNDANVGKIVRRIGYADLLKIQDPDKKARKPLNDGVLAMPFQTIENVDVVDDRHIIVGNDNNLPFSSSRDPNKADDNELVLLEVEALLKAK